MPLTVLSSTDVQSLLLSLTREDIAELQYVSSEPIFPPLSRILDLEACLGTLNLAMSSNARCILSNGLC